MPSAANPSSTHSPAGTSSGGPPTKQPRRWRWWLWSGLTAALIAALFGGREVVESYAKSEARRCIATRMPEAALEWLIWCHRLDPADAETEFLLGRASRKLGQFNLVRDHLARAFKLGYPVDRLEREQILAQAQAGQMSEADPHFSRLLTDPQGDGQEICEAFVHGYYLNRRVGDAFQLLTPWIADYPTSPQPYYIRGHIQVGLQRYKQAEADLRKALELDPRHDATAFELASVLEQLHQPAAALPYFEQAAKSSKFEMLAGVGQSRCLKILGRHDESRAVILRVLDKYPSEPLPHQALGQIELEAGNYQAALKHLDVAIVKLPYDSELRNARGTALRGLKQLDAARREFDYVNEASRAMSRYHDMRDEIVEKPDDYERRFEIGKILLKYSEPREAVIWLQSVLNYAPHHRGTHQVLADYYQSRSKEDPAFEKLAAQHRKEAEAAVNDKNISKPANDLQDPETVSPKPEKQLEQSSP